MRIGYTVFGRVPETQATDFRDFLDSEANQEHDLLLSEPLPTGLVQSAEAASFLQRARCDAVVVAVGENAPPEVIACFAALLAGTPLAVWPYHLPAALAANGALAAVGQEAFWLQPGMLQQFLRCGDPAERQRGRNAALSLYGRQISVESTASVFVDPAAWLHQFGVIVIPTSSLVKNTPWDELTLLLVRQIASEHARSFQIARADTAEWMLRPEFSPNTNPSDELEQPVLLFQLGRLGAQVSAVVLQATLLPATDGLYTARFSPGGVSPQLDRLFSARLATLPTVHETALRAACDALDIRRRGVAND